MKPAAKTKAASRPSKAQIAAYDRGEQKLWRCPRCGHEVEVLSALMVFCGSCQDERKVLVSMVRAQPEIPVAAS